MGANRFWARLAEFPIWIEAGYPYLKELFRNYQIDPAEEDRKQYIEWMEAAGMDGSSPFRVTEEEILREQAEEEEYPMEYLESLAVYRKLCGYFIFEDVLLFHCSAIRMDGRAYLFTAPSGTGKSTHVQLWKKCFGDAVTIINDDKPLLRFTKEQEILVYGTPYSGKDGLDVNTFEKVAGIVALHQAQENRIRRISEKEAYPILFSQSYRNVQDPRAMLLTMELVKKLSKIPVFSLGCAISREAAEIAYQALKGIEE